MIKPTLERRVTVSPLMLGIICLSFAVLSNALTIPRSVPSVPMRLMRLSYLPEHDDAIDMRDTCSHVTPLDDVPSSSSQNLLAASAVLPVGGVVSRGFGMIAKLFQLATRELKALNAIQAGLFLAVFLIGIQIGRTTPFWRRMTSVLDIPSSLFGPKAPLIKGRAVSVSDGDTIRLLHVPTPFSKSTIVKKGPQKEKLSEVALPIRLCTIDTPETAKFGKPGQPFGPEAKEKMKELVLDKMVSVRLLMKDQYGRAVASVYTGQWPFRKAVDELMLKEGLAEVYTGSGAVYGEMGKEGYLQMEEEAQGKKIGIWSQEKRETAAEYKARTK